MIEQIAFDLRDLIDYLEIDEEAKARIVVSTLEVEDDIVEVKELQGHVEGYGWISLSLNMMGLRYSTIYS